MALLIVVAATVRKKFSFERMDFRLVEQENQPYQMRYFTSLVTAATSIRMKSYQVFLIVLTLEFRVLLYSVNQKPA